jgi:hypothetical protein
MNRRLVESRFTGKLNLEPDEGSRHKIYWVKDGDKKITRTQIPRGREYKELGNEILRRIADQLYLKLSELKDAVNCPISEEQFYEIVRQRHRERYQR